MDCSISITCCLKPFAPSIQALYWLLPQLAKLMLNVLTPENALIDFFLSSSIVVKFFYYLYFATSFNEDLLTLVSMLSFIQLVLCDWLWLDFVHWYLLNQSSLCLHKFTLNAERLLIVLTLELSRIAVLAVS